MAVRLRRCVPFDRDFDQWFDGAIFFIDLCAGADGWYWTRPVKSGTKARQRFRSSTG